MFVHLDEGYVYMKTFLTGIEGLLWKIGNYSEIQSYCIIIVYLILVVKFFSSFIVCWSCFLLLLLFFFLVGDWDYLGCDEHLYVLCQYCSLDYSYCLFIFQFHFLPQTVKDDMVSFLKELRKKVTIGVVGGSDFVKIKEQLGETSEGVIERFWGKI